ncbi:MAG: DNA mismatch repair protein MutS, partial [Candidatus Thorarchaeota archaeon]
MKHTPMQRQYLQLKRQFPDSILMFRLGDFYEMFNEDAVQASKVLDIVLTSRGEGVERWPMCGVPYHAVESYVAKLLQAGLTVAIADQLEDPSLARGIVKRDVVRVITPGTVMESTILEDSKNNYLAAVALHEETTGIAAVDISTGEFLLTEIREPLDGESVVNEVARLGPSELLLPESLYRSGNFRETAEEVGARITVRPDADFSVTRAEQRLRDYYRVLTLDGFGITEHPVALAASGAILEYLQEVQRGNTVTLAHPRYYSADQFMILDSITQRNLEWLKNARDGTTRGTLLSVLSRTLTPMGKRLLKQWILQPLRSIPAIEKRLDAVEEMSRDATIRQRCEDALRAIGDIERTTSRITFGAGNARDLLALAGYLARLPDVKRAMESCRSTLLVETRDAIEPLQELHDTLRAAIVEDPPATTREGNMIRPGFDRELDELKMSISQDKQWIASLQTRERLRTG